MADYLKEEIAFLRGLAWHLLVLILAFAVVRTGTVKADSSIGGIPFTVNHVLFVLVTPVYALFVQYLAFADVTRLLVIRRKMQTALVADRDQVRVQTYGTVVLLAIPLIVSVMFFIQYVTKVAPLDAVKNGIGCDSAARAAHFFSTYSGPSMFCLGDKTENNPWIYLPAYDVVMTAIVLAVAALAVLTATRWLDTR